MPNQCVQRIRKRRGSLTPMFYLRKGGVSMVDTPDGNKDGSGPEMRIFKDIKERVIPRDRYAAIIAVFIAISINRAIFELSGLKHAREVLPGHWYFVITILASIGVLFLIFWILSALEVIAEVAAAMVRSRERVIRRIFYSLLVALYIATVAIILCVS